MMRASYDTTAMCNNSYALAFAAWGGGVGQVTVDNDARTLILSVDISVALVQWQPLCIALNRPAGHFSDCLVTARELEALFC